MKNVKMPTSDSYHDALIESLKDSERAAGNIPENFELHFEVKLSQDNRWVIMVNLIPWDEFEEEYAKNFSIDMGAPALPFRTALGSLIIK